MVNLANDNPIVDPSKHKTGDKKSNKKSGRVKDKSGDERKLPDSDELLRHLQNTKKLAQKITGMHPSSLGLHPAVYFYSASGRHQPTAVLSICSIVKDLAESGKLNEFCDARAEFEDFLLSNKDLINQITRKTGSMAKGYALLKAYFRLVLVGKMDGKTDQQVTDDLNRSEKFSFLKISGTLKETNSKEFSSGAKQHAFLSEALKSSFNCKICGARKYSKSMTADHVVDKKDGGLGTSSNLQYVHPYCNSAYKDYKERRK